MMRSAAGKVFKGIGILIGLLMGIALLAIGTVYYLAEERLQAEYEVDIEALPVLTDAASIERGRHVAMALGFCVECHGPDFSGTVFDDGPLIGQLAVSNLTAGAGGIGAHYSQEDWVRSIRHGIGPDGKSLITMPSHLYYNFSDQDLAALIAYLERLPPVNKEIPPTRIGPMARLFVLQDPSFLPASIIDHQGPRPLAPEPGVTAAYGKYLSISCQTCHGPDLSGGPDVGAGWNLTPGGDLGNWTEEDFITTIRTGVNPGGHELDPLEMPWKLIGLEMSDDELKAIWLYLQTIPPVQNPLPTQLAER